MNFERGALREHSASGRAFDCTPLGFSPRETLPSSGAGAFFSGRRERLERAQSGQKLAHRE
jgi:hypothetical protein